MENVKKLENQAIEAAFNNNWKEAINLNKEILKIDKNNLDAILRLGFAYFQNQEFKKAKTIYQEGLKIQPNNPVILNYLKKIEIIEKKKKEDKKINSFLANPELFLEIPGKTKSVALVNLGQKETLAKLNIGEEVILTIRRRRVVVKTKNNEFVGNLPDDIGKRMIILIKGGNQYSVFIKEISLNNVVVFIKEEKKSKKLQRFISFPSSTTKNLLEMKNEEEKNDEEGEEEILSDDLEKLAESLIEEKEDYLPFDSSLNEDFEEEEIE
jgi:Flp pilus assembly protein TadD, contains TPR repeats